MKIWVMLTDDENGTNLEVHFTQAAAESAALSWCEVEWDAEYGPMPDHWVDAYEALPDSQNTMQLDEFDISAHPDLEQPS